MEQKAQKINDSRYAMRKLINEYASGFTATIDFTYITSKLENDEEFKQVIENLSIQEKENLENAVIYMHESSVNKNETDWSQIFYKKYVKYLEKKLNDNVFEYINNKFCLYLIFQSGITQGQEKYDKVVFGRKVGEVFEILDSSYDDMLKKIDNSIELTNKEKEFIENYFLSFSSNNFTLPTSDILKYFEKYPIQNLDSFKNKKLYLLYICSKKVTELGMECNIHFDEKEDVEGKCAGYFASLDDGTMLININAIVSYELKDDEIYFKKIFDIYHEIGHLNQKINKEIFEPELKQMSDMEDVIKIENCDFYDKYHDHFFKEKNANEFAIKELEKDFKDNKIVQKLCDKEKNKLMELYKYDINFLNLLFEEYNRIQSNSYEPETESKKYKTNR